MSNPNCYCRGQANYCIYCMPTVTFDPPLVTVYELIKRLHAIENQPDFLALWKGRPKVKSLHKSYYFAAISQGHLIPIRFNRPLMDWRGML